MSKKKTKQLLEHAHKPGMDKVQQLRAQLDMAADLIIAQKIKIGSLETQLKIEQAKNNGGTLEPWMKHFQD